MKRIIENLPFSFRKSAHTDVLFASDGADWVLSWEMQEIEKIAAELGIRTRVTKNLTFGLPRQSIFFPSKYILQQIRRYALYDVWIALPYFHGYPDNGERIAAECYRKLRRFHRKIRRIQVSHSKMRNYILETGIDSSKVFLIPIGINLDLFKLQTPELKKSMRNKHGLPQQATVIGSFQKDGSGWKRGNVPNLSRDLTSSLRR